MGSLQYQTFLKGLRLLQSSKKKKKKQLAKTCILYIFLESRFSDIRQRFGNFAGAYYNMLFHCNAKFSQKKFVFRVIFIQICILSNYASKNFS